MTSSDSWLCPDCGTGLGPVRQDRCPACGLPLVGPDAAALWQLTLALQALDQHRAQLLGQRAQLLARLRAGFGAVPLPPTGPLWGAPPPGAPVEAGAAFGPGGFAGPGTPARVPEVSRWSAQTALLVLGGLLIGLAAVVFTVVSWGSMGLGGRTAVLLAVTACALGLPVLLRARHLAATAEVVAAVGFGLVLLDCYGARAAGLAGLDQANPNGFWAAAIALTALGGLAYGWALRMRSPLVLGYFLVRLPAIEFVLATGTQRLSAYAGAMVFGTLVDCLLLLALRRSSRATVVGTPAFQTAATFAVVWAVMGGVIATVASVTAGHVGAAAVAAVPLLALTAIGLALALPVRPLPAQTLPQAARGPVGAGATLVALVGVGGMLRVALPVPSWTAFAYAAPAAVLVVLLVLLAPALLRAPHPVLLGAGASAGAVLLLATMAELPGLVRSGFVVPLRAAGDVWHRGGDVGGGGNWPWHVATANLAALGLLTAVVTVVAMAGLPWVARPALEATAVALALPGAALLVVASGAPYWAVVAVPLALAVLATGAVLRGPDRVSARPAVATALVPAIALALTWASASRAATITALAVCAVLGAALTWRLATTEPQVQAATLPGAAPEAGQEAEPGAEPDLEAAARDVGPSTAPHGGLASVAAFTSVFTAGVLAAQALAVGDTIGLSLPATMLILLGLGFGSALVAARVAAVADRDLTLVAAAIEVSCYALAAVALLVTIPFPGRLAFALTLTGVAALGLAALRADRRTAAGVAATCLLLVAWWIRLTLWDVRTPESYTLPLAAVALTIGELRRRRDPAASSWVTYGAGLSLALAPSLLTLLGDDRWPRPLLLGTAALVAVVLGVRRRLQAPLLLGGATLLLTAAHELAPTVIQLLGLLPRWVPMAATGILLLTLGARYEQRLRDARRLRAGLKRLQ